MIIPPNQLTENTLTISQTGHAWLAGQIARHWGNAEFAAFSPTEEILYAAAQHDAGFLSWEHAPTLNPETGLPHRFEELPAKIHVPLWDDGINELRAVCHYAALLTSMHACQGFAKIGVDELLPVVVTEFLTRQQTVQETILNSLRQDLEYPEANRDEIRLFHRQLLSAWDQISIFICRDPDQISVIEEAPANAGTVTELTLIPLEPTRRLMRLQPWPFSTERVRLVCEGRILTRRYDDETTMRRELREAERTLVVATLIP